ncbi:MAG TPA: prepilin-type N-terminal cleavage/methylation domain-containing protein [Patescibacteria group bacterium]|nr:prepilin-type N-terminal cleavage/methylation domain-containing protein [Patescibacteria group bacterium]
MPKVRTSASSGFTLVELLVVIVIISVLATLLMANFVGVRQRGRDAQRKSNILAIQQALELYRSDNGTYPSSSFTLTCGGQIKSPDGSTTYMTKIPCDPLGANQAYNNGNYYYGSTDNGVTYSIGACIENTNDTDSNDVTTFAGANASCTTKYYVLQNP